MARQEWIREHTWKLLESKSEQKEYINGSWGITKTPEVGGTWTHMCLCHYNQVLIEVSWCLRDEPHIWKAHREFTVSDLNGMRVFLDILAPKHRIDTLPGRRGGPWEAMVVYPLYPL